MVTVVVVPNSVIRGCLRCYLGKARLLSALEQFKEENPEVEVRVFFSPYMVDTSTEPEGEEYLAYHSRRGWGDGWLDSLKR